MKILLMTTVMEFGGAQKALLELARGLGSRGHQVAVLATHDKTGVIPHFERAYGIKITNLEMKLPGRRGPIAAALLLVRGLWRMYRSMRKGKYDVLQTFLLYGNLMGQCIGALARIPIRVSSQRNRNDDYSLPTRVLDRLVANSAFTHKMVAVCDANRRYCIDSLGIRAEKLITIHNGISLCHRVDGKMQRRCDGLRSELGLKGSRIVAAIVARLHPQKGHRCLLEAIASLGPAVPDLEFLLVGDGPLHAELSEFIEQHKLSARVRILGNRNDVADILSISDLFILPSLWEGLPNAVLEAMASGLPVIATDVDGTAELVVHGVTGLLVPPGDVMQLAEAIANLGVNTEKRRNMGEAGRRRVERDFSMTRFVQSYEALYVQLAGKSSGAKRLTSTTDAS